MEPGAALLFPLVRHDDAQGSRPGRDMKEGLELTKEAKIDAEVN
jgi:hypothetical protein